MDVGSEIEFGGLQRPDFYSDRSLCAVLLFELDFVVLADLVDQSRGVDENVFRGILGPDETKSLGLIEKLDGALHIV